MDDPNDATRDDADGQTPLAGKGGPLSQLAEKQPAPSTEDTDVPAAPQTTRAPSTGPTDYARGTVEHEDDREA
jgi:hypothetical protein